MNNIITQYNTLIKELETLRGGAKKINLKLERIEHLLNLLGNPQQDFPFIHVGGTSGKGSTSTMIANILTCAGYKTGLFLSPHLQIINEVCQLNNKPVKTSDLLNAYHQIKPAIVEVEKNNPYGCPSYFEVQFALALCLFKTEPIDVGVIEVGLGGALDATNIIEAQVAVLVSVGLDHTEILGNTVEDIAKQKVGIIKSHQPVISGFKQLSTQDIVKNRCEEKQANLLQLGKQIHCQYDTVTNEATIKTPNHLYENVRLKLVGCFQAENAACAVAAVESLRGFDCDNNAIRRGLERAFIPNRLEIVQENPLVMLDGAHNPDKFVHTKRYIEEKYAAKNFVMILSIKSGRAVNNQLISLIATTKVNRMIVTSFKSKGIWESLPAREVAKQLKEASPNLLIDIIDDPIDAIQFALENFSKPNDFIWVTGLFLGGDIREYWYPSEKMLVELEQ